MEKHLSDVTTAQKKSEKVLVDIEPTLESAKQDCMEVAQDHAMTVPVIIRGQC